MDDNWPAIGDVNEDDGVVERGTGEPYPSGKIHCPKHGGTIPVMATAYGFRACCGECRIRWTRLRGESEWVAETYSPLEDNRDEVWDGNAQAQR